MKVADLFSVAGYGAVVTGGASGLGLAFTEVLAENGARVTMLDFSAERLAKETHRTALEPAASTDAGLQNTSGYTP